MYHYFFFFFFFLLPNSIFYNYKNHAPVPKRKNSRQGSHWSIELMLGRNFEDSYLQSGEMLYLDLDSTFHKRPLCLFLSMVIGFPFERRGPFCFLVIFSVGVETSSGGPNSLFSLFLTHVWGLKDYFKIQTVNGCFSSDL